MIDKGNKSGPDGAKSFKFPSTEDTGKTAQDDVEYLDADKIAAAAGNFPKKPVEKPTVVINFKAFKAFQDSVNPSRDTHVQQLPVIKPKTEAQKPVDVTEKRKQAIIEGLDTDSAESRSKIAEFLLFNLRGVRTNQGLPTSDFRSIQELDESLRSLAVLKVEDVEVAMSGFNENGKPKFDTVKGTKIVAIPLPGLKIDGKASELNLEIRYIPGTYSQGSFEVVGVKMASTGEPGILKKLGSFIGMKKKS